MLCSCGEYELLTSFLAPTAPENAPVSGSGATHDLPQVNGGDLASARKDIPSGQPCSQELIQLSIISFWEC